MAVFDLQRTVRNRNAGFYKTGDKMELSPGHDFLRHNVCLRWLMIYERHKAVVLIALVWGRTAALSMLVSLARRPQTTATPAALWTIALQHSRTRLPRGVDLTPQHQPLVLRRGGWRGGGISLAMSTTSKEVPSLSDSRQHRYVCCKLLGVV